eukprot:10061-Pleurochrysis_carterae.AAC.1
MKDLTVFLFLRPFLVFENVQTLTQQPDSELLVEMLPFQFLVDHQPCGLKSVPALLPVASTLRPAFPALWAMHARAAVSDEALN